MQKTIRLSLMERAAFSLPLVLLAACSVRIPAPATSTTSVATSAATATVAIEPTDTVVPPTTTTFVLTPVATLTQAATQTPVPPAATPLPPTGTVAAQPVATTALPAPTAKPTATSAKVMGVKIVLIAVGDDGRSGTKIGCGDSAVPVQVMVPHTTGVLKAALDALLALEQREYGESGLYNALYQSDLRLQSATLNDGKAVIKLTGSLKLGGECDNPRVDAQITQTALQFSTVKEVQVFLNDKTLESALSLK
jgi:hypothetical protein